MDSTSAVALPSPPTWQGIEQAAARIDPLFTGSPTMSAATLDAAVGCSVLVKVETLNPLRCFKGRGIDWFLQGAEAAGATAFVAASAGNFGQALAFGGRAAGKPVTVFASTTANPAKVSAMERLGAEVRLVGRDFDEAMDSARHSAAERRATLVVDGGDPRIAEGAGTIARELTTQRPDDALDAVLVPVGNGALVTGVGTRLRHAWPQTRVIAVAAAGAPATVQSWRTGSLVESPSADTIADGIAVRVPIPYAVQTMRTTVDDVVLVEDADLVAGMRLAHQHLGLVAEPAGSAGLAALARHPEMFRGLRVATILCGSNIDPTRGPDQLFGSG